MERFGYSDKNVGSYSESNSESYPHDRYGFDNPCILPEDLPIEKKPTIRIRVSTTGVAKTTELPPIEDRWCRGSTPTLVDKPKPHPPSRPAPKEEVTEDKAAFIEKLFSSPWLRDYKHLGECLIHALQDDPHPLSKLKHVPVKEGYSNPNYSRNKPYFSGSQPHEDNTTTFNGYNIHISLFLTKENQSNDNYEIFPFGEIIHRMPSCNVIFTINEPEDEDLIGKAYGKLIITREGIPMIKINKLEDFAKNRIKWIDLPVNSNLVTTLNAESNVPIWAITPQPNKVESNGEEEDKLVQKEEEVNPITLNSCVVKDGWIEASLQLPPKVPNEFQLPIIGYKQDLTMNVINEGDSVVAHAYGQLDESGKVTIKTVQEPDTKKEISWKDIQGTTLFIKNEIKEDPVTSTL